MNGGTKTETRVSRQVDPSHQSSACARRGLVLKSRTASVTVTRMAGGGGWKDSVMGRKRDGNVREESKLRFGVGKTPLMVFSLFSQGDPGIQGYHGRKVRRRGRGEGGEGPTPQW